MAFESMSDKMSNTFKKMGSKGKLNENDIRASMREIRMTLLEADVNYQVAKDFIDNVTERAIGQDVLESLTPAQQVFQIVQQELTDLMGGENEYIHLKSTPPTVIMLCGLQGSGKTTHAAKLGKYFTKKGNRPSYIRAAKPDISIPLYEQFCKSLEAKLEKSVATGEFGADMQVELINDGPVTIWIDSKTKE